MHGPPSDLASRPAPRRRANRRWAGALLLVVLAGVGLRVLYVAVVLEPVVPGFDATWYALQAGGLEQGRGYVEPHSAFSGDDVPTASFAPAYPTYQAGWHQVGADTRTKVQLTGLLPGAVTILLTGLLARRVLGPRAALLAAGVVAVDPSLLSVDGSGMSEVLTVPLVVAAVLLAHQLLVDGLRWWRVLVLGVVCGVAVLTRPDLLLLVPLLLVPATCLAPAGGSRRPIVGRLAAAGAGVLVVVAVVAPWAWRNHHQVGSTTIATTSPNSALAGANCDSTYGWPAIGSWDFGCVDRARPVSEDEVAVSDAYREAAFEHAREHVLRLPAVLVARELRGWSLWDPVDLARRDAVESRRYGWQLAARPVEALLVVGGLVGLVLLVRRRGPTTLVLLVPVAVVVATLAVGYGNPRFNAIAHPVLAVGVAWLASRWRQRSSARATVGG